MCLIGRPITPDFLLKEEIIINGHPVNWIDCKLFYGNGSIDFTRDQLQVQVSRFTAAYGPGALLFAFGHCESLERTIEGAIILDASPYSATLDPLMEAMYKLHLKCRIK